MMKWIEQILNGSLLLGIWINSCVCVSVCICACVCVCLFMSVRMCSVCIKGKTKDRFNCLF